MVYPEDENKGNWDMFITLLLIFTSLVTPFRISFVEKDNLNWKITNAVVDSLFLVDILIIFNTSFYDDDF